MKGPWTVSRRCAPGVQHRGHSPWIFPLENNFEIQKIINLLRLSPYHYRELFSKPFPV
jgi:hypothetical protein